MDVGLKTLILDQNARYFGIPIERLMEKAGRGVAEVVTKKFGKDKKIGVFCGLGNNGGDGFVAARYLSKNNKVTVFLIGKTEEIKTGEARKNWEKLTCVTVVNPRPSKIPGDFDIVIEALFGVGVKGRPREPFASVIKRLNTLSGNKIAVDIPAPVFESDLTISMHFPKTEGAEVVDIGIPKEVEGKVGVGEIKALYKPPPDLHKGQNGRLLIIGGSQRFHGAPLLAAKIASKIVDLVYFSSTPENNEFIKNFKSELCEFIAVPRNEMEAKIEEVDCVLLGPGMGLNEETKGISEKLLKTFPKQKFVIDADPLRLISPSLLSKNSVVTPHAGEFKDLFSVFASKESAFSMARKYGSVVVLKDRTDIICSPSECKINTTGNQGMTKGGTGDVLAGLIAAFACKNDLFLAACAGTFVNSLAGDRLKKRVSYYFNASDLVEEIPKTLKWCEEF
jgi:hydroxyethylthiazole kinase-like uncharacterized protein yjeF